MFKKLILAGLLVSASAPAWSQAGQPGAFQIQGNPTSGNKNAVPSNIGSFLTPGTGITVTGTPKATIGLANQITAAGPMGSATQTIVLTYNAQGQITAATLATIAPPFSAITGSLACSQGPARTGDVTSPAGSCVNTTVKVNGVAFGTSPSTDTVPVITATNTSTYTAMPNCTSGGLQYTTATHLFSCGTAGAGNVSNTGTPTSGQIAEWTNSTTIQGFSPAPVANSLVSNVSMNVTASYFTGPTVTIGTSGTFDVAATVSLEDTAGAAILYCKLWDTLSTVIASGQTEVPAANGLATMTLVGSMTATSTGVVAMSCRDTTSTSGLMLFNASGNSKDSTLTAHRIQ